MGAIDMAVWDICGKARGKPVWQRLSQMPQPTITPYASLLPHGQTLKEYRDSLLAKVVWTRDHGFKGAKMEILLKGPCAQTCLAESNDPINLPGPQLDNAEAKRMPMDGPTTNATERLTTVSSAPLLDFGVVAN